MNIQFGTGVLFGVPNAGNLATDPTPQKFGLLQDCQVTFKGDLKKLYGQSQFAAASARGKIDVAVKGKIATLDPNQMNQLYFGQTAAPGQVRIALDEAASVPAATPFTVTVLNATKFKGDYGVEYAATGQRLTLVTGTPTTGEYSVDVATGVYTFAATDTGLGVLISYAWTDTTTGTTLTLTNQLQGYAPILQALMYNTFRGKQIAIQLNACTMGQLSIPSKQEDFWISDFDMEANVDASNTLGYIYADTF